MNCRASLIKLIVFCLFFVACSANNIPNLPSDVKIAELKFTPPVPEEWELENGIKILYLHDDELPLVGGSIFFPGGSLYEDKDEVGLAALTGSLMREGAIPGFTPEEFDQRLDDIGASIGSSFGDEFGTVSFSSLSEDVDDVFSWFAQVVKSPSFDASRLALTRHLSLQGIERRRDGQETMAAMAFAQAIYGDHTPYSRWITAKSVNSIDVKDLRKFHQRFVRPEGALIAIVGSIERSDVERLVNKYFAKWKVKGEWSKPKPPELTQDLKPGIYVLERDFEQAAILIGHRGPKRLHEDEFKRIVFNRLFGHGGFSSMLFEEVRTKLGLAYSVYGGFYPGSVSGLLQIYAGTRASETSKAISKILELSHGVQVQEFEQEKLSDAKLSVQRGFVFRFEQVADIVGRQAQYILLDYPRNYDSVFLENVSQVTTADVRDFAQKWIDLENPVIVIVGKVDTKDIIENFGAKYPIYSLEFDTEPRVVAQLSGK